MTLLGILQDRPD